MIIGIVGLNGSGKDTLAKYISKKYDFEWVSISDLIREECIARGISISSRDNLNKLAEELREKFGPDIWIKKALDKYTPNKKFVLSSFRHPSEINLVKKNKGNMILVDVPIEIRFKRTIKRVLKNKKDHGSTVFEDFVKKEKRELSNSNKNKMQMGECIKMFDYKLDNSSNLSVLKKNADKLMKKLLKNN